MADMNKTIVSVESVISTACIANLIKILWYMQINFILLVNAESVKNKINYLYYILKKKRMQMHPLYWLISRKTHAYNISFRTLVFMIDRIIYIYIYIYDVTYLSILFLMKGGMLWNGWGAKNCKVSPIMGKPIEPGGSLPLHLGLSHM